VTSDRGLVPHPRIFPLMFRSGGIQLKSSGLRLSRLRPRSEYAQTPPSPPGVKTFHQKCFCLFHWPFLHPFLFPFWSAPPRPPARTKLVLANRLPSEVTTLLPPAGAVTIVAMRHQPRPGTRGHWNIFAIFLTGPIYPLLATPLVRGILVFCLFPFGRSLFSPPRMQI